MSSSRKPDEPALVTALFSRRLAEPFARLAVRLGISADAVTVAGGLCWMLSLPLAPLAGRLRSPALWAACAALWCLGYWLDVVDGSVARLTGTSSRAGFFLDCVFHLLFKPAFLFSVGLGAALGCGAFLGCDETFVPAGIALLVLSVLSLPANGAAATSAAELALCEEVALGRLRPDGAARPALWLGASDVAAPAAEKRRTPLRAAKTLAQETLSYYLQGPFFALLVCADFALHFAVRGTVVCDGPSLLAEAADAWRMPITGTGFALLSLVLALRIPLRLARESRRLGRPTRAGRAGRALARLGALSTALGAAALVAWPFAARQIPNERRFLPLFFALFFAPVAFLLLGAGLRAAAARATRRAGLPVHNRYLLRAFDLLLAPTVLGAFAVFLAGNYDCAFGFLFSSAPYWPVALLLGLAPLAAVACRPVASETLAHVLCQETGKGRLRPGDPAPWDAPAPRLVAWVAITAESLLLADTALMIAFSALALGGRALAGLPPGLDRVATVAGHVIERGGLPLCCAGFVLLALALLLSLPRRLRAARRALDRGAARVAIPDSGPAGARGADDAR